MASHVVPMCLIINHVRYMTDLVRMIKSALSAFSQRRVLRLITAKKNLLLRSNEPKSEMMKKISTYLGDSRCSSYDIAA